MAKIRLNKYLASLGIASRRKIDEMTSMGGITINGKTAVLGDKVDPSVDKIVVDKKIIAQTPPKFVYYALNKPKYVLSTASDDRGRATVMDYVPSTPRVFPVGRLDYESTGLLLLTNDGEFSNQIIHPRFHLPKTYVVTFIGKLTPDKVQQLEQGVLIEDGRTAPAKVELLPRRFNQNSYKITLYQGKKRQIRRMCAALHLHVVDLQRISIGSLSLNTIAPGQYRELSEVEIKKLIQP